MCLHIEICFCAHGNRVGTYQGTVSGSFIWGVELGGEVKGVLVHIVH